MAVWSPAWIRAVENAKAIAAGITTTLEVSIAKSIENVTKTIADTTIIMVKVFVIGYIQPNVVAAIRIGPIIVKTVAEDDIDSNWSFISTIIVDSTIIVAIIEAWITMAIG